MGARVENLCVGVDDAKAYDETGGLDLDWGDVTKHLDVVNELTVEFYSSVQRSNWVMVRK